MVMKEVASTLKPVKLCWFSCADHNRTATKSLVCCTHFLTRHHIAYSTNFTQLVDLVVSCGARELQVFLKIPQGMQYTLLKGQWLTLLKHLEHGSRSLF